MANVVITIQLMPTSPDVNLSQIKEKADAEIIKFAGEPSAKSEEKPIAFGLKALILTFVADESKGGTEPLEKALSELEGVKSVQVTDVRRTLG